MLVNSNIFKINSTITDDWDSRHRLVLDLSALATVKDWQFEISLVDDYKIEQIYGAKLIQKNSKNYLSGDSWNKSLKQGEKIEIVLIVDEGNSTNQVPILPEFIFADSINSNLDTSNQMSNIFKINSTITDDWDSRHRLVLDLSALATVKDWQFEISLVDDYKIQEIYGAKLIQKDGKNYLSGDSWNKSLKQGEKIKVVLIIDEGNSTNQVPILPEFIFADSINSNLNNNAENNMLINSNNIEIKSTITDDWGSSHRVVLNLAALSEIQDWQFEISQANDYKIHQIYGAEVTQKDGKKYISGASWNKSLKQGENAEIVLIVDEGNSSNKAPIAPEFVFAPSNNQLAADILNIKSTITDDWGKSHKVVLDLEALATAKDWQFEISLADGYRIDQIYGAKFTQKDGKNYISGDSWNKSLKQGENAEIVLIMDEGNSSNQAPIAPGFVFAPSNNQLAADVLNIKSTITDDWGKSHKVVLDLEALATAKDWQFEISLADGYRIDQIYGAKFTQKDGKNYISGDSWNKSLKQGENAEIVLIMDEGNSSNQAPIAPQFVLNNAIISEPSNTIINVDYDFGGNLEKAIAAADDGDTVKLGGTTYYTNGITINKDITVTGQSGSVINGTSTSGSIINLTKNATGATIENLEITNGTTGIYGYSAFDLTLKNLDINNIGLDQTIRDGQHNTGIMLNRANGLQLLDSYIHDVGRKGVGVNDTDGALISGLSIQNINLDAQHSQSFDAAGIKFFNTNKITVKNSFFSDNNANNIWSDTTNATTIEGNVIKNVGEDLVKPDFDSNIQISGIYNEKSPNSIVKYNEANSVNGSIAFNATEFSTETMTLIDNKFSSFAVNTTDYWVNESIEKLIAVTEDPDAANFDLFANEYFAQAIIG